MRKNGWLFPLVLALTMLFTFGSSVHSESAIYLNPVLGHWIGYDDHNAIDDGPLWGARFGVNLCSWFGIEGFVLHGPTEISPSDAAGTTELGASYGAWGGAGRLMYPAGPVIPFLTVGLGRATMKPEYALSSINGHSVQVESKEKRNLVVFGGGLEVPVHRFISLRFDAIDHYLDRDFLDGDVFGDNKTHNWEFGAGVSLFFGGKKEVDYASPTRVETPEPRPVEKVIIPVAEPEVVEKVKTIVSEPKFEEKFVILAFEDVHFDFDKATLTEEARTILKRSVQILKENPDTKVRIAGYTSASGAKDYNQKLSERRAKSVEEFLISEGIITPDRLTTIGYGENDPAEYEAAPKELFSKAAKANMRVLFEIIVK